MVSTRNGIVVLDFGGAYTQLIARRIREQQVFSSILPCTASVDEIKLEPVGLVLSGGPSSVYDTSEQCATRKSWISEFPSSEFVTASLQWLAHTLGGKVERAERREYGPAGTR